MRLFGSNAPTYGLGRIPSPPDERDYDSKILAAGIDRGAALPVEWTCPVTLNQSNTYHCMGFAGAAFWAAAQYNGPSMVTVDNNVGHELYYAAQAEAGILPNDPAYEKGTYLRALFQALKKRGIIDTYAFARTYDDSQVWIQKYGSVIWGTNWYEGMYKPSSSGLIRASGKLKGGHAYLQVADAQNPVDNGIHNSWGRWGLAPESIQAYISDPDLWRLYSESGEAGMAVKLLKAVPHWPDLPTMNEDDLLSQDAVFLKGIMKGYPDGSFRPGDWVTTHQVGTVMERLGVIKSNPWNQLSDYVRPALRGWTREQLPMLVFNELDRDMENLNRYQLMLVTGRYLRGLGGE